jgi:hypothetical protein
MTSMLEMVNHLLGLAVALSFGTGQLDTAAVVGLVALSALAVGLCAHYLVSLHGETGTALVEQSSFDRSALRVLICQSDPNAAGHQRTRAPAQRVPVAA